ncbi:MAG: hypothetical protein L0I69_05555 [Lactococcus sp.]|nr:hypothetical protein [Lactococcus sp.]MDN6717994.1 hypothetical protein [Lactococcus lactis]
MVKIRDGMNITKENGIIRVSHCQKMQWTGNYWKIDNLPEVSEWLSQFRQENTRL